MNILEELRNDVEAIYLLCDWLGDGGEPVSQMLAEHRAHACTHGDDGYPCKFNVEPNWWDKHVKEPIAQTIRADLELKQRLKLRVSNETSLAMCRLCGCCLALKIWVPTKHVVAHASKEFLLSSPRHCWIMKEYEDSKTNTGIHSHD